MTYFFQTRNKLFSKKKRPINKIKWKVSWKKISSRKSIIYIWNSNDKKQWSVFLRVFIKWNPKAKNIHWVMIVMNTYCATYLLKKAEVFIISMKDIKYQASKKVKAETNWKKVVA